MRLSQNTPGRDGSLGFWCSTLYLLQNSLLVRLLCEDDRPEDGSGKDERSPRRPAPVFATDYKATQKWTGSNQFRWPATNFKHNDSPGKRTKHRYAIVEDQRHRPLSRSIHIRNCSRRNSHRRTGKHSRKEPTNDDRDHIIGQSSSEDEQSEERTDDQIDCSAAKSLAQW